MSAILPIDPRSLLCGRGIESARVEFKAAWDPRTTGFQVLRTICAFANDLHNLNGGYVVLGVAERDGRADLPPKGLTPAEIDAAQVWIRGQCNRIDPPYDPILSPEVVDDRPILVLWAPASDRRPHRAPEGEHGPRRYWVRLGAATVERREHLVRSLVAQTARVPWDDRAQFDARIEDLREQKVREHLHAVSSGLVDEPAAAHIYRRMRLTRRVNEHEVPRNVALLFFADDPAAWYPGARIEVAHFASDHPDEVHAERVFRGGLADQLRDCLRHLAGLVTTYIRKSHDVPEARRWTSYPPAALREALVNAVYHRSYEPEVLEPTKVYVYPGRIEFISHPGPVEGVEARHLAPGAAPPVEIPARNRRIGELLKELRLAEERLTGVPRIHRALRENGSPPPEFDFDDRRRYFRTRLWMCPREPGEA